MYNLKHFGRFINEANSSEKAVLINLASGFINTQIILHIHQQYLTHLPKTSFLSKLQFNFVS